VYLNDATKYANSRPVVECAQCGKLLFIRNGQNILTTAACGICGTANLVTIRSRLPLSFQR